MRIIFSFAPLLFSFLGHGESLESHLWLATKGDHRISLLGSNHGVRLEYIHPRVVYYLLHAKSLLVEFDQSKPSVTGLRDAFKFIAWDEFNRSDREKFIFFVNRDVNVFRRAINRLLVPKMTAPELFSTLMAARTRSLGLAMPPSQPSMDLQIPSLHTEVPIRGLDTVDAHADAEKIIVVPKLKKMIWLDDRRFEQNFRDELSHGKELIAEYLRGEWRLLKAKLHEDGLPAVVLAGRNAAWMGAITDAPRDTAVVVGLAHLLGRGGLLAKLKSAGYRIERINDEGRILECAAILRKNSGPKAN